MSSATRSDPSLGKNAGGLVDFEKMARLGMSPRQQELNHFYAYYRCQNYDARRIDWDGRERVDHIEREVIARGGVIPPGFYDAGATFPLKFRRPTAPYNLVRVIVDRFTGLLFSEKRHPQIRVAGDPATEDYAHALAESGRLWQTMIQARAYGGSMGSVAVGFQFIDGKPVIEAHDPRWCIPVFSDRASLKLKQLDKRYMFPVEERDPQTGGWATVWYWYRRAITENEDVVWRPQLVGDGSEPLWGDPSTVEAEVEHNLGFCPVVWVQNQPIDDSIDGDPDCHGVYEMIESIDALISQANRGIIANCDPTVVISSSDQLSDLAKGSDNALKLTNGTAAYLEISGSGPKAALELADSLREKVLEVAQCVLDQPQMAQRTATEIERAYSSMLSKADILREQYGERCVKPLMEMMVAAARKATRAVRGDSGIVRGTLVLPAQVKQLPDGTVEKAERKLGPGGALKLAWPGYFEPTLDDASKAVTAAGAAKGGGLVDDEHAAKFVAEYFHVEDVGAMLVKMAEAKQAEQDAFAQQSLGDLGGGYGYPAEPGVEEVPPGEAPVEGEPAPEVPLPITDIKLGVEVMEAIVTVNEARQSVGLDILRDENGNPHPDGDLTIAEYKVKKSQVVAAAANVTAGEGSGFKGQG